MTFTPIQLRRPRHPGVGAGTSFLLKALVFIGVFLLVWLWRQKTAS